jgi:hypothetical protein
MKNIFTLLLTGVLAQLAFSQINPVQNLEFSEGHEDVYTIFGLYWDEPESPHDELIGYNIYAEDQLYKFQVETSMGCNPEFGAYEDCDFVGSNGGSPFIGYVAAVYEGGIESEYVSFEVEGELLNTKEVASEKLNIYPNPVQNTIYFSGKAFEISIFDLNGKLLQSISEADCIDVSYLQKGNYVIKYKNSKREIVEDKFIKK